MDGGFKLQDVMSDSLSVQRPDALQYIFTFPVAPVAGKRNPRIKKMVHEYGTNLEPRTTMAALKQLSHGAILTFFFFLVVWRQLLLLVLIRGRPGSFLWDQTETGGFDLILWATRSEMRVNVWETSQRV